MIKYVNHYSIHMKAMSQCLHCWSESCSSITEMLGGKSRKFDQITKLTAEKFTSLTADKIMSLTADNFTRLIADKKDKVCKSLQYPHQSDESVSSLLE